uniref:uncharacterized protein LOC124055068 isoform X2 n=1 Tax=Scatophagus argus TaxID=75038 RepID=UPI001ED82165|nr:uncharacterized protein LOC124055068 isoform X2 [Scatophagus argus]
MSSLMSVQGLESASDWTTGLLTSCGSSVSAQTRSSSCLSQPRRQLLWTLGGRRHQSSTKHFKIPHLISEFQAADPALHLQQDPAPPLFPASVHDCRLCTPSHGLRRPTKSSIVSSSALHHRLCPPAWPPPARPDPFRSGPHPTMDLGSYTFKINPFLPSVQPGQVIVQLTQEEDQAITNLLKLHHQEPLQSDDSLIAPQNNLNPVPFLGHPEPVDFTSAQEAYKLLCTDLQHPMEASLHSQLQQGRRWSETELEAANTLLSCFSPTEKSHSNSVVYLPVLEGSSLPPRLPSLSSDSKAKCVCGDFSEAEGRTLSDSEGDAVHVLLSLGDTGALDTVQ